ncbi:uncharacterized protein LOC141708098 [Apium graveolens]|uniref:uncharacterized protein LOC141708098 n=1 Tax=Apium graveolens TaxID=4045 RepID=UPI003D7A0E61
MLFNTIILGLLALFIVRLEHVSGAGPCGKSSAYDVAMNLGPCAAAAQDENATVSESCCLEVKKIGQNPSCLCAAMLSDTAKSSGVDPKVAMSIPKRCDLAGRPVGYKCGRSALAVHIFVLIIFLVSS